MLAQLQNAGAFTQRDLDVCNRNFNLTGGLAYGAAAVGEIFCVDPVTGNDNSGDGTPEKPFVTINMALEHCVSGRGDSVVVAPGEYNESLVITKDYVTLIGMAVGGYARPDIGPAATTERALTVTAQGFVAIHCRFFADAGDAVKQEGNGFLYIDCVFDGDGTALMAGLRLRGNDDDDSWTASEGRVTGNYFRGSAIGIALEDAAPPSGVGSTDNFIDHNRFNGNTVDIATVDGGGGVSSVASITIAENWFTDKAKAVYIDMTTSNGGAASAQTGMITGNWFNVDDITAGNQVRIVGTGFGFVGNFTITGVKDGTGLD